MKTLKHLLSKIARNSYLQPCLHFMDYEFEAHVDWEPEDE